MEYITADDYRRLIGEPPDGFDTLNAFTTGIIDQTTLWGLVGREFSELPQFIRDSVQKAAAYEVQYLDELGGISAVNESPIASASLGKYSFTISGAAEGVAPCGPLPEQWLIVVNAWLRGVVP